MGLFPGACQPEQHCTAGTQGSRNMNTTHARRTVQFSSQCPPQPPPPPPPPLPHTHTHTHSSTSTCCVSWKYQWALASARCEFFSRSQGNFQGTDSVVMRSDGEKKNRKKKKQQTPKAACARVLNERWYMCVCVCVKCCSIHPSLKIGPNSSAPICLR